MLQDEIQSLLPPGLGKISKSHNSVTLVAAPMHSSISPEMLLTIQLLQDNNHSLTPLNKCNCIQCPLHSPPSKNQCHGQWGQCCSPWGCHHLPPAPWLHHSWAKKISNVNLASVCRIKAFLGSPLVHWQNREVVGAKVFLFWFLQISRNSIICGQHHAGEEHVFCPRAVPAC